MSRSSQNQSSTANSVSTSADDKTEEFEALNRGRVSAGLSKSSRRDRALEILHDFAISLMNCNTDDEVCWEIAKGAIQRLELEDCVVYMLDPISGRLLQRAAHGPKNPQHYEIADPIEIDLGQGIVGSVGLRGLTERIRDTRKDTRYIVDDNSRLSELAVPIKLDDRVVGVIDSEHPELDYFDDRHVQILEAVASMAATRFVSTALMAEVELARTDLERSRQEYKSFFDTSPSALISCDDEFTVRHVNQTGERLLGRVSDRFVGMHLEHAIGSDGVNQVHAILKRLQQGKSVLRQDFEFSTTDAFGKVRWMNVDVSQTHDSLLIDCQDITVQRSLAAKLRAQAEHDGLTGVLNRAEFESRLQQLLNTPVELASSWYQFLFVDIDRFKNINDRYGHSFGDAILIEVAHCLNEIAGPGGFVGRYGGDEFAVVVHRPDEIDHNLPVAQFQSELSEKTFPVNHEIVRATTSIGVVQRILSGMTMSQLMMAADTACYESKRRGRNTATIHSSIERLVVQREHELSVSNLLRQALEQDQLVLYAQVIQPRKPELDWGKEILTRLSWVSDEIIGPNEFVPIAERFGLAPRVDLAVVQKTIAWMQSAYTGFQSNEFVCINLSGCSLSDDRFLQTLEEIVARNKHLAHHICIEITETVAMIDVSETRCFMQRLRNQGVRFALDDFGVGVSSMSYLKELPVDIIKIDGNFVKGILNDKFDLAMVSAFQKLASALGILTIAECVEDINSIDMLDKIGIDMIQGYGVEPPQPLAN